MRDYLTLARKKTEGERVSVIMSNLITTAKKDIKKTDDYQVKWSVNEMTDYIIKNNKDENAVFRDGKIVSADGIDIKVYLPDGGADNNSLMIIQNAEVGYSDFTIIPENNDNIEATFYFRDYALSVKADAEMAGFTEEGSINLENAEGTVNIGYTLNHSKFDFVMIKGQADGEVLVSLDEDSILVKGGLLDFKIQNTDIDGNISEVSVSGKKKIKAYMSTESGELSMTYKIIE